MEYRTFNEKDAKAVHDIALEAWKHTYGDIFSNGFIEKFVRDNYSIGKLLLTLPDIMKGSTFFEVAVEDGKVVGFCHIGNLNGRMELVHIYLIPQYIGKGIGKALIDRGEEFIRAAGALEYFCFVNKNNSLGINFYLKNGFRHVPKNDKGEDWYLEKIIK